MADARHPDKATDPFSGFQAIEPLLKPVTAICGHYGVGKTSLAVSLAIDAAACGYQVALSDMDVVNPYFRSSDYKDSLERYGVRLIEPVYARSNLDGPSITNETLGAAEWACAGCEDDERRLLLIDAGGDDVGATVLGRFSVPLQKTGYSLWYVVNQRRGFDHTPEEALGFLREIESACHMRASGVVGNSHLREHTSLDTVVDGIPFAQRTAQLAGLPLLFATVPRNVVKSSTYRQSDLSGRVPDDVTLYAMGTYVVTPWEHAE